MECRSFPKTGRSPDCTLSACNPVYFTIFNSFYEEIQSEFPILVNTKNLFLSEAEPITQSLCLWRNEYGRPLAMEDKRAKPTRAL
jgi:hypothetical protein